MNDAYYSWLIGLIGDNYIQINYQNLLWKLFRTEFIWELDYDRNRAEDGLYLRQSYVRQGGFVENMDDFNRPCTLLEMMVALARRAEDDIMHDPEMGDRSGVWFWNMMENLGLDIYDDYHWYESEVSEILNKFLHHRYGKDGKGGAFPMRSKTRDLRKTDLWWQMNAWLEENYAF